MNVTCPPKVSVLLRLQQTVLFGKMIDILGGGARGIEDCTWFPCGISGSCLPCGVQSVSHTPRSCGFPGEQGSILQQQTKAIIPAGAEVHRLGPACLGDDYWDQEVKPVDFGPGCFWVTRLRGGSGHGSEAIWKLTGTLVPSWEKRGGSLNPKTQATLSSWNQASNLRTVHRWVRSFEKSKGQRVSKPNPLTGSHYEEHNCFKSFKASIPITAQRLLTRPHSALP